MKRSQIKAIKAKSNDLFQDRHGTGQTKTRAEWIKLGVGNELDTMKQISNITKHRKYYLQEKQPIFGNEMGINKYYNLK